MSGIWHPNSGADWTASYPDNMDMDEILQPWDPSRNPIVGDLDIDSIFANDSDVQYYAGDSDSAEHEMGQAWYLDADGQEPNFGLENSPPFNLDSGLLRPSANNVGLSPAPPKFNTLDRNPSSTTSQNESLDSDVVSVLVAFSTLMTHKALPVLDDHIQCLGKLTGASADAIKEWFSPPKEPLNYDSGYQSSPNDLVSITPRSSTSGSSRVQCLPNRCCQPSADLSSLRRDSRKIYQCTRKCGKHYPRKSEWKRHEEDAYPLKQWQCALCATFGRSMRLTSRRDKYLQHFRNIHPGVDPLQHENESVVSMDGFFPTWCGFCQSNAVYTCREDRLDHIEVHFKQGKCMADWVDEGSSQSQSEGDDDDHDNDDDSGHSPSSRGGPDGSRGPPRRPQDQTGQSRMNPGGSTGPGASGGSSSTFGGQYQGSFFHCARAASRPRMPRTVVEDAVSSSEDDVQAIFNGARRILLATRVGRSRPHSSPSAGPSSSTGNSDIPRDHPRRPLVRASHQPAKVPTVIPTPPPPLLPPAPRIDTSSSLYRSRTTSGDVTLDALSRLQADRYNVLQDRSSLLDKAKAKSKVPPPPGTSSRQNGQSCSLCSRSFESVILFSQHIRDDHRVCTSCGKSFCDAYERAIHMKSCRKPAAVGWPGCASIGEVAMRRARPHRPPSIPGSPLEVESEQVDTQDSPPPPRFMTPIDQLRAHRLTKEQFEALEQHYQADPKPGMLTKRKLTEQHGVPLNKINNWFQNRRARDKQALKKEAMLASMASTSTAQIRREVGELHLLDLSRPDRGPSPHPPGNFQLRRADFQSWKQNQPVRSTGQAETPLGSTRSRQVSRADPSLATDRGRGSSFYPPPGEHAPRNSARLSDPSGWSASTNLEFPSPPAAILQGGPLKRTAMDELELSASPRISRRPRRMSPLSAEARLSALRQRETLSETNLGHESLEERRPPVNFPGVSIQDILAVSALAHRIYSLAFPREEASLVGSPTHLLRNLDLGRRLEANAPRDVPTRWSVRLQHMLAHLAEDFESEAITLSDRWKLEDGSTFHTVEGRDDHPHASDSPKLGFLRGFPSQRDDDQADSNSATPPPRGPNSPRNEVLLVEWGGDE